MGLTMALMRIFVPDDKTSLVVSSLIKVQPARNDEERSLTPARLANKRIREFIRDQVVEAERQRLHEEGIQAARQTAETINLSNPDD